MDEYLEILRDWQRRVAQPAIFENMDTLFPEFGFVRYGKGDPRRDHWASPYKMDGTSPSTRRLDKTVVTALDFRFHEQGNWDASVGVMDMIMRKNCFNSVYDAYKFADSKLGLGMPIRGSKDVTEMISKRDARRKILNSLNDYFAYCLSSDKSLKAGKVRQYLRKRGFTDEQARDLSFGYVPDWSKVLRHMTIDLHYGFEDVDEACSVRTDGKTSVGARHILSIPVKRGGELAGFIFRRIDDSLTGPKYIVNTGLDRRAAFFNIPMMVSGDLVVVEGEIDALKATAAGIPNVVAIGGSEIAGDRRQQVQDALARGARMITICLDLDERKDAPGSPNLRARHEHIMKSIHTIRDVDPGFDNIYVASLPEISDPDEYIRNRGVEAFKSLLWNAPPFWKYVFEYYSESENS